MKNPEPMSFGNVVGGTIGTLAVIAMLMSIGSSRVSSGAPAKITPAPTNTISTTVKMTNNGALGLFKGFGQ